LGRVANQPGLTREWEACGFFYLKSNVFWSIIQQSINLQICLFYIILFKMYMPTKKYIRKKTDKLFIMGEIVIESHSFLKILTEPLNPRAIDINKYLGLYNCSNKA